MPIIAGHHVPALQSPPEGWQATSLLERCREHTRRRRAGGAAARAYLGEINDTQELAWRRSIEVLEDGAARPRTLSLFPQDRVEGLLADALVVGVRLSELRLRRPRQWGACWLALMAVARSVQHQLRRAAIRPDEHLFRIGSTISGRRQAALWVLARSPAGLCADCHCPRFREGRLWW